MTVAEEMRERLTAAFNPTELVIEDDSASHAGHSGNPGGDGETHFNVLIRAEAFSDMNLLARHRAVHAALGDITTRIHALSINARP